MGGMKGKNWDKYLLLFICISFLMKLNIDNECWCLFVCFCFLIEK